MAVLFTTDFESYATGWSDLAADGWLGSGPPFNRTEVVTTESHGGSKSCQLGDDLISDVGDPTIDDVQILYRNIAPSTQSVSAEAWFRVPYPITAPQSSPSPGGGIAFFYTGSSMTISGFGRSGTTVARNVRAANLTTVYGDALNVLPGDDTWYSMKLQICMSTVNAAHDGVNSDGCVTLYVNDVAVVEAVGVEVAITNSGWASGLNYPPDIVEFNGAVWVDDITVTDDIMPCVPQTKGRFCCGYQGTITAPRAVLFSLNGSPNTNDTPGLFKIAGDLEVTGTANLDTITSRLDGLGS